MIIIDTDEPIDLMEQIYYNGGTIRPYSQQQIYGRAQWAMTSFFVYELMIAHPCN